MARLAAQRRAAALARDISGPHRDCPACQRGGRLVLAPGGPVRERCAAERELFAALDEAWEAGWPAS